MIHTFNCSTCEATFERYCFDELNYTEAGRQVLNRQLSEMKCLTCLGETPELKPREERRTIPAFDSRTFSIEMKLP